MRRFSLLFLFGLLISSCGSTVKDDAPGVESDLFQQPIVTPLNTTDGYALNALRGDSVYIPFPNVVTGSAHELSSRFLAGDTSISPIRYAGNVIFSRQTDAVVDIVPPVVTEFSGQVGMRFKARNKQGELGKKIEVDIQSTPADQTFNVPVGEPYSLDGDQYGIKIFDIDQGLRSSYVWFTFQDSRGDIWISYDAGGVSRFDGKNFTHYGSQQGFYDLPVYHISEDKSGNLWFTTESPDVVRYDGTSFTKYHIRDKDMGEGSIWCTMQDRAGNFWFGTGNSGVVFCDGQSIRMIDSDQGLSAQTVFTILQDKQNYIWFGTSGGGATRYDGSHFEHFGYAEGLTAETVYILFEDSKGILWFGTDHGAYAFDGKTFRNYAEEQGMPYSEVMSITEDSNGTIWFATFGGGLCAFDGEIITHQLNSGNGLSTDVTSYIFLDDAGQMWISTNGGGVCRYNPKGFSLYTESSGLSVNTIWSMLETKNGDILLGGLNGTVDQWTNEPSAQFQPIIQGAEFLTEQIFCMLEDHKGRLWFGTYGNGLICYDPSSAAFEAYTADQELGLDGVLSLHEDAYGTLWIGTNGSGLYRSFEEEDPVTKTTTRKFVNYDSQVGFLGDIVISISEDSKGLIWIGTYDGGCGFVDQNNTSGYADDEFTFLTEKEGLSNNGVLDILEDKNGDIWIATNGGGVCKYTGEEFVNFTHESGIANDVVWTILEDRDERLWLGTYAGLTCVLPDGDSTSEGQPKFVSYLKNDGLKGVDFVSNSAILSSDNSLWFGTGKNLMRVNMNEFELPNAKPKISLRSIEINDQKLNFASLEQSDTLGFTFSPCEPFTNYPQNLTLEYDKNHLKFDFSALDWSAPHDLRFQYKLEGIDQRWSQFSKEPEADYRNLPYGEYTLRVRAIGKSQQWSDELNYTFTILPPWWHTWWARMLYALAFVFVIFQFVRWRTLTLKRRQKELEEVVTLRTSELVQEKKQVEIQKELAEEQRELVEEKNKEILDSINYAKRIQTAILPPARLLNENLGEYFIYYVPKDIVAGDFYWMHAAENMVMLAAADCTGHGVPGALVSVVCNNALNRAVREFSLTDPAKILDKVREIVISEFEKSDENVKDGMDISLTVIRKQSDFTEVSWSGANNPLWILRSDADQFEEIAADKQPIGKFASAKPFTSHRFVLKKGDAFYIFTDGLQDQFGGPKGKKFKAAQLKDVLISVKVQTMQVQQRKLQSEFETWKGNFEQIDDVCVIGVRI